MIEIRPIRPSERETYLKLLCKVFDLDYSRANSVFFSEPMLSFTEKWALFQRDEMCSILTTVPLEFGVGRAIGVAGVGTVERERGQGLAATLMEHILAHYASLGAPRALLFARRTELYSSLGFTVLDHVVRADLERNRDEFEDALASDDVQTIYDEWASLDPMRLRRGPRRWEYWRWNMRVCNGFGRGGYLCLESDQVREALPSEPRSTWPVPRHTEFVGLRTMIEHLQVPVANTRFDLFFMGRGFDAVPQMFMTDQF